MNIHQNVLIILLLSLPLNQCKVNNSQTILSSSDGEQQKSLLITYTEESRGSLYEILAIDGKLTVESKGFNPSVKSRQLRKKDWQGLQELVSVIAISNMQSFAAENQASASDRAAIANLSIKLGDSSGSTKPFDAGNPPAEVNDLINRLLELADDVD